jgi:uncharacterized membrane protein
VSLRKGEIISLLLLAVDFAAAFVLLPAMPERMAVHWDISGNVNGYMPKHAALFIIPCLSALILAVFFLISRMDPKGRLKEITGEFDILTVGMMIFLGYTYFLLILWNEGSRFEMSGALTPAFSGMLYMTGIVMEKVKPNYFIGIRTRWTLENPVVWEKTHKLGAVLFKICAIISIFAMLAPKSFIFFVIAPLSVSIAYLAHYSYAEFKKLKP